MKKFGIIYIATSKTSGKSYIGQTTQSLNIRVANHKNSYQRKYKKSSYNSAFYRAMRKYGFYDFEWKVLQKNIPFEKLNDAEMGAIAEHDTYNKGYNSTIGGNGTRGYKSKPNSGSFKRGIIPWNKGILWSEDIKKKMSISSIGQKSNSGSFKKGQVPWNKGKSVPKMQGINNPRARAIKIYKNGILFKEFGSIADAVRTLGLDKSCIYSCLNGSQKTHHGYTFEYKE